MQKSRSRTRQRKIKVPQDEMAQLLNVDDSDAAEDGVESGDFYENEDENAFNI